MKFPDKLGNNNLEFANVLAQVQFARSKTNSDI